MSRIGVLQPIDVETPHGSVRVSSRYRADKKCYRLILYGAMPAVQWMLPKRSVTALPTGMAQVEVSHPDQPITTIAALDQFRRELVTRWEERLELGADDPGLAHLHGQNPAVALAAQPTTLGAVIDRYLTVHQAHLRPRTLVSYRINLNHWLSRLGRQTPMTALTADSLRLAMANIATTRSPATANSCLRVLKVVLNYAVAEGYLNTLPHQRVGKLPAPPKAPTWWSRTDVAKVLAAAQADREAARDAHLLVAIALYLGLRKGEIDRLRWEDLVLDGERPVCTVRSTATELTKSGKARHIPICKELRAILQPYRLASGYVLRSANSKGKWTYRFECDALFARVMAAAGVPTIRFHDMRHTFASLMLEAGVPMFKVSQWLGHSDIRITQQTYAHLAPYDPEVDLLSIGEAGLSEPISDPTSDPTTVSPPPTAPSSAPAAPAAAGPDRTDR
jgi:integrase